MKPHIFPALLSLCCAAFPFPKNVTLSGMAENTFMPVAGANTCNGARCEEEILVFSGMVYDSFRHKILAFGGGHATGYFPSNVAEFDFSSLKWTYAVNIDSVASCGVLYAAPNLLKNSGGAFLGGFTRDGKIYAGSRHTYDGLLMAPDTDLMICAESMDFEGCDALTGPQYRQGSGLFLFNPAVRTWSVSQSASLGIIYSYSAADPGQPDWYYAGGGVSCSEFCRINWKTEQKISLPAPPVCDVDMSMAYYPEKAAFLAFPQQSICEYDIARNSWKKLSPAGTAPNGYSLNVVYDTLNKVFACFYNGDFYYYSPAENRWRSQGKNFSMSRLFHHHVYDPVNNVHLLVGIGSGPVWETYAYKFSDTPGKFPGTGLTLSLDKLPAAAELHSLSLTAAPNPSRRAAVAFELKGGWRRDLSIDILDVSGKRAAVIDLPGGKTRGLWKTGGVPAGIYFATLRGAGKTVHKTLCVTK